MRWVELRMRTSGGIRRRIGIRRNKVGYGREYGRVKYGGMKYGGMKYGGMKYGGMK